MIIISHRGYWKTPEERNSGVAFERTVRAGYGTETDVRDRLGELVVAHDPALAGALSWDAVLDLFDGSGLPLAVNIKSDGLSDRLAAAFRGRDIDWFAFDMSGPETLRYSRAGLPFFTRHSDIEPNPILYHEANGVWLDSFGSRWFDQQTIECHLDTGKRVCVVSCELHGRDPIGLWTVLRDVRDRTSLILCTDRPEDAREHIQP